MPLPYIIEFIAMKDLHDQNKKCASDKIMVRDVSKEIVYRGWRP